MGRGMGDSSSVFVVETAEETEGIPMDAMGIVSVNGLAGGLAGMVAAILSGSDSKYPCDESGSLA